MTAPYYEDDMLRLFHGNAADLATVLGAQSVQTIVTSPPYWGLRDYGVDGQLGSEATVEEYVDNIVAVFAALRPALADDGTLWLNLGDSYVADAGEGAGKNGAYRDRRSQAVRSPSLVPGLARKNLVLIPARVSLALQADGWIIRKEIVWSKPNPMPEPVTDRPTSAHEVIFLIAKSARYFYDAEGIAEGAVLTAPSGNGFNRPERISLGGRGQDERWSDVGGKRNKRDVWTVATVPFAEAHFAVYPPELIRPCILAGSRAGDTVLDPFSGSGTTGKVAIDHGRRYVGFDLNSDYLDLSLRTRFAQPSLGVDVGL